jgi:hypothetical protein
MSHSPDRNPGKPLSSGDVVRRVGTDLQDQINSPLSIIGLALDFARSYMPENLLPTVKDADNAIAEIANRVNRLSQVGEEPKWRSTPMGPALDLDASIKPAETKPDTTA